MRQPRDGWMMESPVPVAGPQKWPLQIIICHGLTPVGSAQPAKKHKSSLTSGTLKNGDMSEEGSTAPPPKQKQTVKAKQTGFNIFSKQKRPEVNKRLKENPELAHDSHKLFGAISTEISRLWKALPDMERAPYHTAAADGTSDTA